MKPAALRILAATDLSGPARHAVERAFSLAAVTGSELHILHAMELDNLNSLREMLGGDVSAVKKAISSDAQARLTHLTGNAAIHRGVNARTHIAEGNPLTTIAAEEDRLDPALVVLGARGESFLRHSLLGSTSARLLRKSSSRPVLVVKQAPHEAYRSVMVTVDFSQASIQAIRLARQWAPDADFILLHAFQLPFEAKLTIAGVDERVIRQHIALEAEVLRQRLHDLAATAGLQEMEYTARIVHGDPTQQIMTLEQEFDADLIIIGKHGAHIAEELLLGSVTKHVLAESQCDVLVICDTNHAPEQLP